jgi:hypothetical protein
MQDAEILPSLKRGERLERPEESSREIYNIMQNCWLEAPTDRPTFQSLSDELQRLVERPSSAVSEANECQVCMAAARYGRPRPCGHHCVCEECYGNLRAGDSTCPICRAQIEGIVAGHFNQTFEPASDQELNRIACSRGLYAV